MNNLTLTEFESVLKAAQEKIDMLKAIAASNKNTLNQIKQNNYDDVYNYIKELNLFIKKNKINDIFVETPIKTTTGKNFIIRITSVFDDIRVGVYDSTFNKGTKFLWYNWIVMLSNFSEVERKYQNNYPESWYFLTNLIENFSEYEPIITQNFQKSIIKYTAEKIEEAQSEVIKTSIELNQII